MWLIKLVSRVDPRSFMKVALAGIVIFMTPVVNAATVLVVGRTFVVIDAGLSHGLRHGEVVCLQDGSGTPLGCGNVGETRPRLSEVRVPSWTARRIQVGDVATGRSLKAGPKAKPVSQSEIFTFVRVLEKLEGPLPQSALAPRELAVVDRTLGLPPATLWFRAARLKLAALSTLRLPFTYSNPKYNVEGELKDVEDLWTRERQVSSTPWGGELALSIPFTDHLAVVTTAHFRKIPDDEVTTSYDNQDPSLGTMNTTGALTYGGGFDIEYGWPIFSALEMIFSFGVEGDRSRVKYKQTTQSPLEKMTVARATSQLLVWSGRAGLNLAWALGGGFALDLGGKVILPQAEHSTVRGAVPGLKERIGSGKKDGALDSLKSVLDHHKSSLGTQVTLGLSYGF